MTALVELCRPVEAAEHPSLARRLPPRGNAYFQVYHIGEPNRCPGCSMSQWIVGRMFAECAFCSTAVPLQHVVLRGPGCLGNSTRQTLRTVAELSEQNRMDLPTFA